MASEGNRYARTTLYNTVSSIVLQVVVMVIGFIIPKLYIVAYGSEVNGLVTSITQFISYFTIVEAGLSSAGINALYKPIADKDIAKVNGVLSAIRKFYFQIGFIFSGLVGGLAILYPLFVSVDGFTFFDIAILVFVLGLHGTIDFFTLSKYRALLTADQKYYVFATASIVAHIVNFVAVYFAIDARLDITYVRIIALTLYIVRSIIVNIYVRCKYKTLDNKVEPDTLALNKRWDAMLLQLLGLAQSAMPVVVLTIFSEELANVSVYSIYNLVASGIVSLLFTVTNGMSAVFGNVIARGDKDGLKTMYRGYEVVFLAISAAVYSCVLVMYIPFIRLYTEGITDYNYIYPMTAVLFTLNGVMYNLKTPAGTLIGSAGVYKETKLGTIIQTVIAIVLCFVLTPFLGINGLLVGLIVSNLYRDIDLVVFMNKKVLDISLLRSFANMGLCVFIPAAVGAASTLFTIEPDNYFHWIIIAFVVLFVSAIISFVSYALLNWKMFVLGLKRVFCAMKRRKNKD